MDQASQGTYDNLSRGTEFIGVNCVFWCHDSDGKILLHKRSQNCRDERGAWDAGGGAMEFGETFEKAVRREVKEEYGTEPLKVEYVGTRNVLRKNHEGKPTHWVKNLHWVLVDPNEVKIGEPRKMDEIGWFSVDNLPQPLHSQMEIEKEMIKEYLGRKTSF